MNENARPAFWVGLFALLVLAAFVVAVLSLSQNRGLWTPRYELLAYFDDVQGLIDGAPVRLAGKDIGIVEAVRFSEFDSGEAPVRVDLSLERVALSRIRTDSVATIRTFGLLGDKYVEVTIGTTEGIPLADGAVLASSSPPNFDQVVTKGTNALDEIATLAGNVNRIVDDFSTGGVAIAESFDAIAEFMKEIRDGQGLFHSLIYDEYEGEGVESISRSLVTLEQILREVAEGDGLMNALIYDSPGEIESLGEINEAAKRISSILKKIDEGEGTMGLLVTDPTLYEDVKRLVGGAQRSLVVRSLINLTDDEGDGAE